MTCGVAASTAGGRSITGDTQLRHNTCQVYAHAALPRSATRGMAATIHTPF